MTDKLISLQAAKTALSSCTILEWEQLKKCYPMLEVLEELPSAQPDTSRIENVLHGKSPEEQYDFLHWLMAIYAMQYTDSRAAVIAWLGGAEGR